MRYATRIVLTMRQRIRSNVHTCHASYPITMNLKGTIRLPSNLFHHNLYRIRRPNHPISNMENSVFPILHRTYHHALNLYRIFPINHGLALNPSAIFLRGNLFLFRLRGLIIRLHFLRRINVSQRRDRRLNRVRTIVLIRDILISATRDGHAIIGLISRRLLNFRRIGFMDIRHLFHSMGRRIRNVISPRLGNITFTCHAAITLLRINKTPECLRVVRHGNPFLNICSHSRRQNETRRRPCPTAIRIHGGFLSHPFNLNMLSGLSFVNEGPRYRRLILSITVSIPLIQLMDNGITRSRLYAAVNV